MRIKIVLKDIYCSSGSSHRNPARSKLTQ